MKNDIRNIINLEKLTRVRSSLSLNPIIPTKNSLVKLIPLEYLEHGVKVLINGKLFIAVIDEKIPIKEEVIAVVTSENPFSLSLNLFSQLKNNEKRLLDQICVKLKLQRKNSLKTIIPKIIKEDKYIAKSKILLIDELLKFIKADGLEFSLLVDLVWSNNYIKKDMIGDLYENLFDESFQEVSEMLFQSIKGLLFTELPQYLIQKINNNLIYSKNSTNYKVLLNKVDSVFELIRQFNELRSVKGLSNNIEVSNFIRYGTKYILQKSVLKDYDYFPDFIIVKRNSELILIHYGVKRVLNSGEQTIHKLSFKNDNLPFELKGVVRDKFFDGALNITEEDANQALVSLEENLFSHWGFRSDIKFNNKNEDYYISKINAEVNKLVS
jgi:hypothetical protein